MVLNSTHKKIKKVSFLLLSLAVIFSIFFFNTYPKRSNLIMTPSSHEMVEFLKIDQNQLGDYIVEFAIYDKECDYYQICFRAKSNNTDIVRGENMLKIYADGEGVQPFSFMTETSFWKKNIIVLLKEYPRGMKLVIEYRNDISTIYTT